MYIHYLYIHTIYIYYLCSNSTIEFSSRVERRKQYEYWFVCVTYVARAYITEEKKF